MHVYMYSNLVNSSFKTKTCIPSCWINKWKQ